jgi:hypothetical protein
MRTKSIFLSYTWGESQPAVAGSVDGGGAAGRVI